MPEGAMDCTRPGWLGNPFTGPDSVRAFDLFAKRVVVSGSNVAHALLLTYLEIGYVPVSLSMIGLLSRVSYPDEFRRAVRNARGKDLACWCPLDQPCHADVLLELANR
jgi:hypothetical protein